MIEIIYTVDCHCGGEAESRVLDATNPQDDGTVRIDVNLSVGCSEFTCPACGCATSTGDIDLYDDEAESCPGRGES